MMYVLGLLHISSVCVCDLNMYEVLNFKKQRRPAATPAGFCPSKSNCLRRRAQTCRPNNMSDRRNGSL